MTRIRISRPWIVLTAGLVLAAIFVGGVVAAQVGSEAAPEGLEAAIRDEPLTQVVEIPEAPGLARRAVYVQQTSAGFVCLWDAPNASTLARQGGCNRDDDPLAGKAMLVSLAYDGGPAVADVKDARLIGLVLPDVARVEVAMSDGTRRAMRLKKTPVGDDFLQAFGYRFRKADLRRGVAPTAVVALDASGKEIERQATGFAGK